MFELNLSFNETVHNLNKMINEEGENGVENEQPTQPPPADVGMPDNEPGDTMSSGNEDMSDKDRMKNELKPLVDSAYASMTSLFNSFANSCNGTKKMNDMLEQFKSLEKLLRGTCEQAVVIVQKYNFNTEDNMSCSPKAYKILSDSSSRDTNIEKLVAALTVFYNSLG